MKNIMNNSDFLLSPFVITRYDRNTNQYMFKNILYQTSWLSISSLDEFEINKDTLSNYLFINNIEKEKKRAYDLLESQFEKGETCVGYIETTSICPYRCKMCPKNMNDLIRKNPEMDIDLFEKIIDQLTFQSKITFHLFGDPLYDSKIYERVIYANQHNILPDFSVNLISLSVINLEKLSRCKIDTLTISLDSINADEMTFIRGKISQEDINQNINKLEKLIIHNEKYKFIRKILIQSIDMTFKKAIIEEKLSKLKKYSSIEFINKKFISFPKTYADDLAMEVIYEGNNILFLYTLIGSELPFKCLKAWKKEEYGITSDGYIVPCCMTFNSEYKLGDVNHVTLEKIFASNALKRFRKDVFNSNMTSNSICANCTEFSKRKYHSNYDEYILEKMKKWCIQKW